MFDVYYGFCFPYVFVIFVVVFYLSYYKRIWNSFSQIKIICETFDRVMSGKLCPFSQKNGASGHCSGHRFPFLVFFLIILSYTPKNLFISPWKEECLGNLLLYSANISSFASRTPASSLISAAIAKSAAASP